MQPLSKVIHLISMKYYIYTLEHPITNEIRYIGKTNNLKLRFNRHNCPTGTTHKENWIKSLKKDNLKPIMNILEEFDNEKTCYQSEVYWISQFKTWGFNLVNIHEGGKEKYSNPMKKEIKEKVSKTLKERYKKQQHHLKGKKQTEEHKLNRSIKMRGRKPKCSFKGKKHNSSIRKTVNVFKDNILIDTLPSVLEASIKYKVNAGAISSVCLGKAKTAKGYTFKYLS